MRCSFQFLKKKNYIKKYEIYINFSKKNNKKNHFYNIFAFFIFFKKKMDAKIETHHEMLLKKITSNMFKSKVIFNKSSTKEFLYEWWFNPNFSYLRDTFKKMNLITEIKIYCEFIIVNDLIRILEMASEIDSLKCLIIIGLKIRDTSNFVKIRKTFGLLHNLRDLSIEECNFSESGFEFYELIRKNKNLKKIEIINSMISNKALLEIKEAIKENNNLTRFVIKKIQLAVPVKYLGQKKPYFEIFELLSDEVFLFLCEIIKNNYSLESLEYTQSCSYDVINSLPNRQTNFLIEALKTNHFLSCLDVYGNDGHDKFQIELGEKIHFFVEK